ncbi:uncharacterized protein LOC8077406 [Sorghum bicolor]|uniref:uncharacterized protein LOC8077406 n=1 Tax=Sorghum bicolor TaxID=4558 RepID=UPI000B4257A2|nr:uncharacterized protein LOC8077406 [Sorghum bicolor]|eukprot:XP_002456984.2 uncharacterized protein LOC8077406 [Sorghum bicolor]
MPNLETLSIVSETETVNTPVMPSKFLHLKSLTIALRGQTYDCFSLLSFFDASPFLENFILNVSHFCNVSLTLDTTHGAPRCSVSKHGRCWPMRRDALMEAHRALSAVQTYVKSKVPSTVELNVFEPCSQCHAVAL